MHQQQSTSNKNISHYIILSDVHLGGDLVQHVRPWTADQVKKELQLDRNLASFIDYYLRKAEPEGFWTLVIAGDLVDFMGMAISTEETTALQTPLLEEEIAHGLGSAADHAVYKMLAVARRHPLVFRKLAQFVAAGHQLILIHGNHDIDFYWEPVRQAFIQELTCQANLGDDEQARQEFEARIQFRQWFYYVKDTLYVEHGHQYDETCAYHHCLAPLSPEDPKRLSYSFSDILTRYIVRPTRGLSTYGHEKQNILFYLKMAFSMGVGGCWQLTLRFARAVYRMLTSWRAHLSEKSDLAKIEHERQMQRIARRLQVSIDRLQSLAALWATPVTGRLSLILRSVFLDVTLAAFGIGVLLILLAGFNLGPLWLTAIIGCVGIGGIGLWVKKSRVLDAGEKLRKCARKVVKLLPARFVVMGHTHMATIEPIDENHTYINLGSWSVDALDKNAPEPLCSYLVIRQVEGEMVAELIKKWPVHELEVMDQR